MEGDEKSAEKGHVFFEWTPRLKNSDFKEVKCHVKESEKWQKSVTYYLTKRLKSVTYYLIKWQSGKKVSRTVWTALKETEWKDILR